MLHSMVHDEADTALINFEAGPLLLGSNLSQRPGAGLRRRVFGVSGVA